MPIYTGKSTDGSDMQEAEGMYTDGKIWSNKPFTKQHIQDAKNDRAWKEILEHINNKRTLMDEYNLIIEKKSGLTARCKRLLIDIIERNP